MNQIKKIKSFSKKEIEKKLKIIKKLFAGIPIIKGKNNYPFVYLPLTEFKPAMKPELIEIMADLLIYFGNFEKADIIVSEGDRGGGPLTHAVAIRTGLPYTLANWYPKPTKGTFSVKTSIGYAGEGVISLNGVVKGNKAIIIDDLLASGGTVEALVKCIYKSGGKVLEALFVGEKVNMMGRKRLSKYNLKILTLVPFVAKGKFTKLV